MILWWKKDCKEGKEKIKKSIKNKENFKIRLKKRIGDLCLIEEKG